jgi:sarcosine oxidase
LRYDAVVAGLGAMGSAATYQLAKSGANVLGLDRYLPPHALGSTHGDTRITRRAIGEGLEYVPLVRRSHELWREIEQESGTDLLTECGGVVMGLDDRQSMHGSDDFLGQTIAAARAHDIEHEVLAAAELSRRFPPFAMVGDEVGYVEPGAGFVRPERAVEAQLLLARRRGATIGLGERVLGYDDHGSYVTVHTTHETVEAGRLVITAGPWASELVPQLDEHLTIYRQVLFWFDLADPTTYEAHRDLPVFIWWTGAERGDMIYGFPMIDGPSGGLKVAGEQYVVATTPDDVDRRVSPDEIEQMYEGQVRHRLPGLSGRCVKARACLYTVAPDSRFIIDVHPTDRNVIVASPCSGHGFKHSAAIGEALAQWVTTGETTLDLSPFGYPVR